MRKLLLATLSTFAITSTTLIAENDSGLYIGLGYASTNVDVTIDGLSDQNQKILDSSTDSIVLSPSQNSSGKFGYH